MISRYSAWLTGWMLAIVPVTYAAPVPAGDPATAFKPTLTVRIAPPDQILADIRFTAELVARFAPTEKEAKEFTAATEAAIEHALGPDWRKALDAGRPLFGYGTLDANLSASAGVVMVPVKDRPAFETLLRQLVGKVETGADGILRFETPGARAPSGTAINGYLRFAHQYAYITMLDPAALATNRIPTPAQIATGDPAAAASVRIYMDRLPERYRQQALAGVQQFRTTMSGNGYMLGISPTLAFAFAAPLFQLYSLAEPAVRDGQELTLDIRYDRKRLDLSVEAVLTAKAGSELSRLTAALQPATSLFPQMLGSDLAARGIVRGTIPEEVRKALVPQIEAALAQGPREEPVWGAFAAKIGGSLAGC